MTDKHEAPKVPHLITLPTEDREKIFSSALHVLKHTGISVHDEKTLNILGEAGARIDGNRAYIPSRLVEHALETAPKEIQIYTMGLSFQPVPNVVIKADYRNRTAESGRLPDEFNLGVGFVF